MSKKAKTDSEKRESDNIISIRAEYIHTAMLDIVFDLSDLVNEGHGTQKLVYKGLESDARKVLKLFEELNLRVKK